MSCDDLLHLFSLLYFIFQCTIKFLSLVGVLQMSEMLQKPKYYLWEFHQLWVFCPTSVIKEKMYLKHEKVFLHLLFHFSFLQKVFRRENFGFIYFYALFYNYLYNLPICRNSNDFKWTWNKIQHKAEN